MDGGCGGKPPGCPPLGCPGPVLAALGSLMRCCVLSGVRPTLPLGNGQACPCGVCMGAACTDLPSLDRCSRDEHTVKGRSEKPSVPKPASAHTRCDPVTGCAPGVGSPATSLSWPVGRGVGCSVGLTFKKTHFMVLSLRICCCSKKVFVCPGLFCNKSRKPPSHFCILHRSHQDRILCSVQQL